jgi:hypothetical protein
MRERDRVLMTRYGPEMEELRRKKELAMLNARRFQEKWLSLVYFIPHIERLKVLAKVHSIL